MSEPELRLRQAARLLVIDAEGLLLLFDTKLAYTRVWLTPGGGLEAGESYEEGALRELWEETGLKDVELGPCVWSVDFRFRYDGVVYDQRERYFVVRVDSPQLDDANRQEAERDEIVEQRWWSLDAITASRDDFRPANLAALLKPVLSGDYPAVPVSAPVEAGAVVEL